MHTVLFYYTVIILGKVTVHLENLAPENDVKSIVTQSKLCSIKVPVTLLFFFFCFTLTQFHRCYALTAFHFYLNMDKLMRSGGDGGVCSGSVRRWQQATARAQLPQRNH